MNKKGFTLTEILAVIVLLAIVITLAVPATMKIRSNLLEKEDNTQINSIETAAIYYAQDKITTYPQTITVDTLLTNDYLKPTIENGVGNCNKQHGCLLKPSNSEILNSKQIVITKNGNKTKAKYQE